MSKPTTFTQYGLHWKKNGWDDWRPMSFRIDSEDDGRSWLDHFRKTAHGAAGGCEYRLMSRTVTRTESEWEVVE